MVVDNSSISSIDFIRLCGYFCFMPHTELDIEGEESNSKICMAPGRQGLTFQLEENDTDVLISFGNNER